MAGLGGIGNVGDPYGSAQLHAAKAGDVGNIAQFQAAVSALSQEIKQMVAEEKSKIQAFETWVDKMSPSERQANVKEIKTVGEEFADRLSALVSSVHSGVTQIAEEYLGSEDLSGGAGDFIDHVWDDIKDSVEHCGKLTETIFDEGKSFVDSDLGQDAVSGLVDGLQGPCCISLRFDPMVPLA